MDVDFAFVCDYADVGGKINALGIGFDTIFAPQVPATHPSLHLVAQLSAHSTEAGTKSISLRLIDADGKDILPPMQGSFEISKPVTGTESKGRIHVALANLKFEKYGMYSFHVVIQGQEMIRIPFRVAAPPTTA